MPQRRGLKPVRKALEEARFGPDRTLNLRSLRPTPEDAAARADQWLRLQQAQRGGEVLIITGRGNKSFGGVSVVREAISRKLGALKRQGVITAVEENTPGSFIVKLASMRSLLDAPRRHRSAAPALRKPVALSGLDDETQNLLQRLAECALDRLGVRDRDRYVEDEMQRQFSLIVAELPSGTRRDEHLRVALQRALAEYEAD